MPSFCVHEVVVPKPQHSPLPAHCAPRPLQFEPLLELELELVLPLLELELELPPWRHAAAFA